MRAESISLEGFDRVEAAVLSIAEEVGYVTLYERSATGKSRRIDQIQVTVPALADYLERLPAPDEETFEDEFCPDDEPDDSEEGESLEDAFPPEASRDWTAQDLLHATLIWVHDTAIRAAQKDHTERFWLRYQAPKGARALCTLTFSIRNPPWATQPMPSAPAQQPVSRVPVTPVVVQMPAPPQPIAPHPSPTSRPPTNVLSELDLPGLGAALPAGAFIMPATFQDGSLYGTAGAFRVLSDTYQEYGRIMMAGVSQLQGMMREVVRDLGTDLRESRSQVGSLVDKFLEGRVHEVEAQEQAVQSQESGQRMLLAREALAQIGEVARAFFVSRGIPPEVGDVAGLIAASPGLMTSLQDPQVKTMLEKPENLETLGSMLKQIAGQAAALEQAGAGATPSQAGFAQAAAAAPSAAPPTVQPGSGWPGTVPPTTVPPTGSPSTPPFWPNPQAAPTASPGWPGAAWPPVSNPQSAYPPGWNGMPGGAGASQYGWSQNPMGVPVGPPAWGQGSPVPGQGAPPLATGYGMAPMSAPFSGPTQGAPAPMQPSMAQPQAWGPGVQPGYGAYPVPAPTGQMGPAGSYPYGVPGHLISQPMATQVFPPGPVPPGMPPGMQSIPGASVGHPPGAFGPAPAIPLPPPGGPVAAHPQMGRTASVSPVETDSADGTVSDPGLK